MEYLKQCESMNYFLLILSALLAVCREYVTVSHVFVESMLLLLMLAMCLSRMSAMCRQKVCQPCVCREHVSVLCFYTWRVIQI